ncbi:hypothetical protein CFB89_20780 [Burkholderia sp. AU16741]|nr:hypothetical protein CFB89_20780 [Burkholderia sp. AU16741]
MTRAPGSLDVLQGTPLDALKSAIEIGRVAVEIDRTVGEGGGSGGGQLIESVGAVIEIDEYR